MLAWWQTARRIPLWAWQGVLQHQWQRRIPQQPHHPPAGLYPHWRGTNDLPSSDPQNVLPTAQRVLGGVYPLFGAWVSLGTQPAWQHDWQAGYDWAQGGTPPPTADIKRPWELARCQWLPLLALAFQHSQDTAFAESWLAAWQHFAAHNPVGHGIHWRNPMEVAIRAANWILSAELLTSAGWSLPPDNAQQFAEQLWQHGQFIAQHRELAWPRTNHLLADDCGLIWLGTFLGQPDWLQRGQANLLAELHHQITSESLRHAVCYEGSTSYHTLDCEMLLWTMWYSRSIALMPTLQAMLYALKDLGAADAPLWGDSDSGRWVALPLLIAGEHPTGQDPTGLLALAQHWEFIPPLHKIPAVRTLHLLHCGWHVLRRASQQLSLTQGKLGTAGWGGHSHNDALSVTLLVGQQPFLVDAGSYCYNGDRAGRDTLRGTAQHSTLQVGNIEQNDFAPNDLFCLLPRTRDWGKPRITAESVRAGYQRLAHGHWLYRHERTVAWDGEQWLLTDTVQCAGQVIGEMLCWRFVFHPSVTVQVIGQTMRANAPDGGCLRIAPKTVLPGLKAAVALGWYAPCYNQRQVTSIGFFELPAAREQTVVWQLQHQLV